MRPAAPVTWPAGKRAAAALTFDMDAESAVLFTHPHFASRMSTMSHQAYGPLVGVPRLLRLLDDVGVRATFFVPGYTAHRYPDVVRAVAEAGHEIAHHGYLHESPTALDHDQECRALDRGLDALQEVAGVRPVGYRAPMWELHTRTPALLADRGFRYDSSLMDADVPYLLDVDGTRSLVEIPIQWALDDWEQYAFIPDFSGSGVISTPTRVLELWTLELDALHAEGGCFVLTNHPFLSGRPSRAAALRQLVAHMQALDGLWIAPLAEIAEHVASSGASPRRLDEPVLPADLSEDRPNPEERTDR